MECLTFSVREDHNPWRLDRTLQENYLTVASIVYAEKAFGKVSCKL